MRETKYSILLQHEDTGNIIEKIYDYADIFNGKAKDELASLSRYYVIARREFTGLIDKNGKCIFESDIIGREDVYHFISRAGWDAKQGSWLIIGEKLENFTGKENGEEKYIAGYKLVVVEASKKTGFEPFCDSEDNCHCCGGGADPSEYEVLGNKYEHPTLLQ